MIKRRGGKRKWIRSDNLTLFPVNNHLSGWCVRNGIKAERTPKRLRLPIGVWIHR